MKNKSFFPYQNFLQLGIDMTIAILTTHNRKLQLQLPSF